MTSFNLIYKKNAVPCSDNILSYLFSPSRLSAIGIIEPEDVEKFPKGQELNIDIINTVKAEIKTSGQIPFLVFDDEDDEIAWQRKVYLDNPMDGASSIEEIYESLGYPSKRGPFFFGNFFRINRMMETSVIFTQDGFIVFNPTEKGKWQLCPWEAWRGSELATSGDASAPLIHLLPGDAPDLDISSCVSGSKMARQHESIILVMKEIVDQFWEVVEANRESKALEIPMNKFRFITRDNINDYIDEILNKAGILSVIPRESDTNVTPGYPGEFYFDTSKYSMALLKLNKIQHLSRANDLFRKFETKEVEMICRKITVTRTIPLLRFAEEILEEKYNIGGCPFWFMPFVIAGEKVGCFIYLTESGLWGNFKDQSGTERMMDSDVISSLTYSEGFDDDQYDDEKNPRSISTIHIEIDDGFLTINEFHGKNFGSQLRIIKAVWDLWEEIVAHGKGSEEYEYAFHPYDKDYPGAPCSMEFDSWNALLQWASSENKSTEKVGKQSKENDAEERNKLVKHQERVSRVCPFCKKEINKRAVKCQYCKSMLSAETSPSDAEMEAEERKSIDEHKARLLIMNEIANSYVTNADQGIYIAPNIDQSKLSNFLDIMKEKLQISLDIPNDTVSVYYYETGSGNSNKGVALLAPFILCNVSAGFPLVTYWHEIQSVKISGIINRKITFTTQQNEELQIVLTHGNKGAEVLVNIIQQYLKKTNVHNRAEKVISNQRKGDSSDERYDEAVELVTELGHASISLIQRYMKIGYNEAARLIEQMESEGVIGPSNGLKPRKLLANKGPH